MYMLTPQNQKRINKYISMLEQMRSTVDCDNLYLPAMFKLKQNDSYCSDD
jgi:hypothetical protein